MPVAEGRVVSGNFLDNGAEETGDSPLSDTHKPMSSEVDLLHNGGPPTAPSGGGESILDIFGNGPSSPGLVANQKPVAPPGHSGPNAPASNALLDLLSDLTGPPEQSNASVSPPTVPSQTGNNALALKNSGLGIFDGLGSGSSGPEGKKSKRSFSIALWGLLSEEPPTLKGSETASGQKSLGTANLLSEFYYVYLHHGL